MTDETKMQPRQSNTGENTGENTEKQKRGRIENLRPPWPKGVSPNPGGRPRRRPITEVALEVLVENDGKLLQKFVRIAVEKAIRGDLGFWREIREAIEGKSPLPLVGPDEGPVLVSDDVDERLHAVVERLRARLRTGGETGAV
jgi:hypothetical protein